MIKLEDLISELQVTKPGRWVYAMSDSNGSFYELLILKSEEIVKDEDELNGNEDAYIIHYKDGEKVVEDYYISKIKI